MEAKIKQLNDDLEMKIAVHDVLTLQLKRLQVRSRFMHQFVFYFVLF